MTRSQAVIWPDRLISRPIISTLASGWPSLRLPLAVACAVACWAAAFGSSAAGRLAISGRKVGVGVSDMAAPGTLGLDGRTGLPTARRWAGIGGISSSTDLVGA